MNRRFRASELSLHDVAESIAPWNPHVETSPGAPSKAELPPSAAPGVSSSGRDSRWTRPEVTSGGSFKPDLKVVEKTPFEETDLPGGADLRAQALDGLHTYVVARCGYDHALAMPIFNRIVAALDTNLDQRVRAEQDPRR